MWRGIINNNQKSVKICDIILSFILGEAMKAVITIILSLFVSVTVAQEVIISMNAKTALKSCQEKAKSSPKELQDKMLASCNCVVKHTDFKQANNLNAQGKNDELKALYDKAVTNCSKKEYAKIN